MGRPIFLWLARSREYIARHGITPPEAQHVAARAMPPFPRETRDGKQTVWGRTSAGRYLQVIFVFLEEDEVVLEALSLPDQLRYADGEAEVAYIIHARDLTPAEKRQFRKLTR